MPADRALSLMNWTAAETIHCHCDMVGVVSVTLDPNRTHALHAVIGSVESWLFLTLHQQAAKL